MGSASQLTLRAAQKCAKHIMYADRGLVVLNKPPGMVCQPESWKGKPNESLRMMQGIQTLLRLERMPSPCHRLDKLTTGALLCPVSPDVEKELHRQFASREVEKSYLALVRGGEKSFPGQSGEIKSYLRTEDGRVSVSTGPDGSKEAITGWELLATSPTAPLSLVKLQLHTGYKHQLRIHLAKILQTPILGDTLYSSSKPSSSITTVHEIPENSTYLHSSFISFSRYRTSGPHKRFRLGLMAPLPDDFVQVCKKFSIPVDESFVKGGVYLDGEEVEDRSVPDLGGRWLLPQ